MPKPLLPVADWLTSNGAQAFAILHCWIKEEEVDLSEYLDYNDAYRQIEHFLDDVYMHKRIHSSLGYLTPAE